MSGFQRDHERNHYGYGRRDVLRGGAVAAVIGAAAGCGWMSTNPKGGGVGSGGGGTTSGPKGKEAPILAKQVKAGKLPKVADRMPDKPMTLQPIKRVGAYGDTWHTALLGTADTAWLGRTIGYEPLLRWNLDFTEPIPNVAESVEPSPDHTEFTVHLRKGMKWSDGEPLTADDLVFYHNDVMLNTSLNPVPPSYFVSGDKPATLKKLDDQTVRFSFVKPNGMLMLQLAWYPGSLHISYPKHYLKQFHKKFNPDADKLAKKEGFGDWVQLFLGKIDPWSNADLPRVHPWRITTALGKSNQVVAQRNPYFFKTDPEGSQLPYIDQLIYYVVDDLQVILLKATNGELDFHTRHINTPPNKPVLARNRGSSHFDFDTLSPTYENEMVIALNLAHEDPVKREIFGNKDFRIGLSHALDRPEMIKTVYQSQAKPWQAAPRSKSEFYDKEFAEQYTEHDVDKANQYLDKAGYTKRDSEGFRKGPDGKRIFFAIEVATPAVIPFWADGMQLAVGYWKKVGIDSQVKSEDRSLFYTRKAANKHDATVWTGAGGLTIDAMIDPRWYFPYSDESNFAIPWAAWFTSHGTDGVKPPAPARKQMELYWQLLETGDEAGRKDLFRKILAIARDEFWVLGSLIALDYYGIVKDDFHNVPATMPESNTYQTPGGSSPEQYFIQA